jgi:hypothetical protein
MAGASVKATPLLATPETVTTTLPVLAPAGTWTRMLVALQVVTVAATPLNATVLAPCVAPKFTPVMVTAALTTPDVGVSDVMIAGTTKFGPLLACVPTVTITFPVVVPTGTVVTMLVALQTVGTAVVPLNVSVLVPCVAPKFVPVIVTVAPTAPKAGVSRLITGPTVKTMPLLATPATVTTTLPVVAAAGTTTTMLVALHVVIAAAVPLKATALVLCVAPKPVPVIVSTEPTAPSGWLIEVMTAGTTNMETLLATPDTVTTMGPEAAPTGTNATMDVLLQLETTAVVPLNVTVLLP